MIILRTREAAPLDVAKIQCIRVRLEQYLVIVSKFCLMLSLYSNGIRCIEENHNRHEDRHNRILTVDLNSHCLAFAYKILDSELLLTCVRFYCPRCQTSYIP